jgi:hypothetical protein
MKRAVGRNQQIGVQMKLFLSKGENKVPENPCNPIPLKIPNK